MSRQKSRNIRLLILVSILLVSSIAISFLSDQESDNLDVNKSQFTLTNTIDINKVVAKTADVETRLEFLGGTWLLDGSFEADPTNIHLMFAAIQQLKIRRPVSGEQFNQLTQKFQAEGTRLEYYEGEKLVLSLETLGDEMGNISYFRDDSGKIYIMEIPGYRAFIHGLLAINPDRWRNHHLLHKLNWINLKSINVSYPGSPSLDFQINLELQLLSMQGGFEMDSLQLVNYVDYVSTLYADSYVSREEVGNREVVVKIDVRDVGNRPYIMELLEVRDADEYAFGRMDSEVYFRVNRDLIEPLLADPAQFSN